MRHFLHIVWRILKPLLEVAVAVAVVVLLVLVPTVTGSTGAVKDTLRAFSPDPLATTGPIPGNLANIPDEVSCMERYVLDPANFMVNYPPAIGSPEHTDAVHSGVVPCAIFTGDFEGPNQVLQYQSQTSYPGGIQFVVFGGPDAAFLQGGGLGSPSAGQYVSRFNPQTGAEIWRTYLANSNADGRWIAFGSMAVLEDGSVGAGAGAWFYRLDPDTGAILAAVEQPILAGDANDANFDGFQVAPDEAGTILMKTQNRPSDCPTQGNTAMSSCQEEYGDQPHTTVAAADPETMENIDAIELSQAVTARTIIAERDGNTDMYFAGNQTGLRVIWDDEAQTLTEDTSWAPEVLLEGQTGGPAPSLIGDWVIFGANAQGSDTTPICAVAVHVDDDENMQRVCPWGETMPEGQSFSDTVGSFGVDPENNLIFVQDFTIGGVYALRIDQATGEMEIAWSRPDWRVNDYFSLVGPADERVLVTHYLESDWSSADLIGYNWTESLIFVDALTGETVAQSAYVPSTALGSLVNPGYGGRFYLMGNQGSLYIFQPLGCSNKRIPAVSPPSTTTCSTDYSTLPQPTAG